jgi:hypothetical protein
MAHEDMPTPIGIPGAENVYPLAEDVNLAFLYKRREQLQGKSSNGNIYSAAWNDIELAINNPQHHARQKVSIKYCPGCKLL